MGCAWGGVEDVKTEGIMCSVLGLWLLSHQQQEPTGGFREAEKGIAGLWRRHLPFLVRERPSPEGELM